MRTDVWWEDEWWEDACDLGRNYEVICLRIGSWFYSCSLSLAWDLFLITILTQISNSSKGSKKGLMYNVWFWNNNKRKCYTKAKCNILMMPNNERKKIIQLKFYYDIV